MLPSNEIDIEHSAGRRRRQERTENKIRRFVKWQFTKRRLSRNDQHLQGDGDNFLWKSLRDDGIEEASIMDDTSSL